MIGWGASIAFLLLIGILILIYRNYKSKKRSSEAILRQKNEIEHQRDIAESRRKDLEVVNAEITDSINYAKRIQNAIMPSLRPIY
jgi:type VI protein secretion system component VasK